MKLSDTQRVILSQASQRGDRLAIPPARLSALARQMVAKSLLKQGLVSDEHAGAQAARAAWHIDDQTRLLCITDAGLRAVGVAVEEVAKEAEDSGPRDKRSGVDPCLIDGEASGEAAAAGDTVPADAESAAPPDAPVAAAKPAQDAPFAEEVAMLDAVLAAPRARPTVSLRVAVQRVLAIWDGDAQREGDMIGALDGPMAALRVAMTSKPARATRVPDAPRKLREGTKQETLLALLRRAEGATIAQICAATSWQQHTARGFLAALKQKGITVDVLERVRVVGQGKEGGRGSYSIYRIAD